jgi:hypothetical protein
MITSTYNFSKVPALPDAFENYLNVNNAPLFAGFSSTQGVLSILTSDVLTTSQLDMLTTLVNNYIDPPYYLQLDHKNSVPLYSQYTSNKDLAMSDNSLLVLQTLIFPGETTEDIVLDEIKTVFEYHCPNVQNFLNSTTGSLTYQIYDMSRNIEITTQTIDLMSEGIIPKWNTLAQTGSTISNSIYKTKQLNGLMNKTPNYDCVWQLRLSNPTLFSARINGLEYLYFQKEVKP